MRALARYIEEEEISVGLGKLDENPESLQKALEIFNTPPFQRVMENFLIENCDAKIIIDAFWHKFKVAINADIVGDYRRFFFDTNVVNTYDIAKYYEKSGRSLPKAPPVPGRMREAYTAFKNGEYARVMPEEAMMHLFQQAFFRAQELSQLGWQGDDKALRFMKEATNMLKTVKDLDAATELPDAFQFEVEYPESTAIDVDNIEGYDPDLDPNDTTIIEDDDE